MEGGGGGGYNRGEGTEEETPSKKMLEYARKRILVTKRSPCKEMYGSSPHKHRVSCIKSIPTVLQ